MFISCNNLIVNCATADREASNFAVRWSHIFMENDTCTYRISISEDTLFFEQNIRGYGAIYYKALLGNQQKQIINKISGSSDKKVSLLDICPINWSLQLSQRNGWVNVQDSCTIRDAEIIKYLITILPIQPDFSFKNDKPKYNIPLAKNNSEYHYHNKNKWFNIELILDFDNDIILLTNNRITYMSLGTKVESKSLSESEIKQINSYISKINLNSKYLYQMSGLGFHSAKVQIDNKLLCVQSPMYSGLMSGIYSDLIKYILNIAPLPALMKEELLNY